MSSCSFHPHRSRRRPEFAPRIDIHAPDCGSGLYSAVVVLRGEHDLSSSEGLRVALAATPGRLLLDLTTCCFLDPTIIGVILGCHERLAEKGSRLEVLLPHPATHLARVLDIVQIRELLVTHEASLDQRDVRR